MHPIRRIPVSWRHFRKKMRGGFFVHEWMIERIYGKHEEFFSFSISEDLCNDLGRYLKSVPEVQFVDWLSIPTELESTNFKKRPGLDKLLDEGNKFFLIGLDPVILKLHAEITKKVRGYCASPLSVINTRAWSSMPRAEKIGPFSFHTDGFSPGHLKCMVYLTPMSRDFGTFEIKGNKPLENPAGTVIIFRNSDLLHRGVPGERMERISIEVTLMRTLVQLGQNHPGHANGRHYRGATEPYLRRALNLFKAALSAMFDKPPKEVSGQVEE
jgi:hypothetical protein